MTPAELLNRLSDCFDNNGELYKPAEAEALLRDYKPAAAPPVAEGPAKGSLGVGHNEKHEIVVNHPDLQPDENGVGHIVFSIREARNFANLLIKHAEWAEAESRGRKSPWEGITSGG